MRRNISSPGERATRTPKLSRQNPSLETAHILFTITAIAAAVPSTHRLNKEKGLEETEEWDQVLEKRTQLAKTRV